MLERQTTFNDLMLRTVFPPGGNRNRSKHPKTKSKKVKRGASFPPDILQDMCMYTKETIY